MDSTHTKPCEKEATIFVACLEKKQFPPPCMDLILEWDKCMEKQKLIQSDLKYKSETKKENA